MTHLGEIWIISLGSVHVFSKIDVQKVIHPCLFSFNFLSNVLASTIKRNIALIGDAYSRPLITIRSHDLHIGDIKRAVGVIASYNKKD
jgi:hypothetical protein